MARFFTDKVRLRISFAILVFILAAAGGQASAQEAGASVTQALAELSKAYGKEITSPADAKVICNQEKFVEMCAGIGKRYNLYKPDQLKQVDALLEEIKGSVSADLRSCATDECLIGVARQIAKKVGAKNPKLAIELELTEKKVREKEAAGAIAKEIGVDFKTCREMDPDAASVELLRSCARLANDPRVEKHISADARQGAKSLDAMAGLQDALARKEFACGDGTPEGCGNYCLKSDSAVQSGGIGAIPAVCRQIATRFFGPEGVKSLEAAYQNVSQAAEFYTKKADNVVFTAIDGRTLTDPAAVGRYLEEEGQKGNVEAVAKGMDFMVVNGFITPQDKEFALKMVRQIKEKGGITFAACSRDPQSCAAYVPDDYRQEFDAVTQVRAAVQNQLGFNPDECAKKDDESLRAQCFEAVRRATPQLETLGNKNAYIERFAGEIKDNADRIAAAQKFNSVIKSSGGPGGCQSESACSAYCSDPAHGPECIAFGAKHQVFNGREIIDRYNEYNAKLQAPSYGAYNNYPRQGYEGQYNTQYQGQGQFNQGPYPGFVPPGQGGYPPGQIPGFNEPGKYYPGPGANNTQGPPHTVVIYQGINPECAAALQSGDFVKAKEACYVPPAPVPPSPIRPPEPPVRDEQRPDAERGKFIEECVRSGKSFNDCEREWFAHPGPKPIGTEPCPAMPTMNECPAGQERYASYSSASCGQYYTCRPAPVKPAICPAMPTVASCAPDEERVVNYSSSECGVYYGCKKKDGTSLITQCSDGKDNDNDGSADYPADKSCYGKEDNDEWYPQESSSSMKRCFYPNATQDGKPIGYTAWCEADYFNCHKGNPSGEALSTTNLSLGAPSSCEGTAGGSKPQCSDGIDNDNDGKTDYPADTSCYSVGDWNEAAPSASVPFCSDGKDNDNDGKIDYPADQDCYSKDDWDEWPANAACPSGQYWSGSACVTSYYNCDANVTQSACGAMSGCAWHASSNSCKASGYQASTSTSYQTCGSGQYWNGSSCINSSGGCGMYASQTSCVGMSGCSWSPASNSCYSNPTSGASSCASGQHWNGTACITATNGAGSYVSGTSCSSAGYFWCAGAAKCYATQAEYSGSSCGSTAGGSAIPAPTGLTTDLATNGKDVNLRWNNAASNLAKFKIWQRKDGSWSFLTEMLINTYLSSMNYTVVAPAAGMYEYMVQACTSTSCSPDSNAASIAVGGGSSTSTAASSCTSGQYWNGTACIANSTYPPSCSSGQYWNGSACMTNTSACSSNQYWNGSSCVTSSSSTSCGSGQYWNGSACVATSSTDCTSGQYWNGSSCVSNTSSGPSCGSYTTQTTCPTSGCTWYSTSNSCMASGSQGASCTYGQYWNGTACVSGSSSIINLLLGQALAFVNLFGFLK